MSILRHLGMVLAIFLLAACTTTPVEKTTSWQGRLALKIYSDPIETFSADFELEGNATTGTLTFSTPLGLTAAQLEWGAQGAKLRARGEVRDFESLDALTLYAVGSKLPIASLFAWLQRQCAAG